MKQAHQEPENPPPIHGNSNKSMNGADADRENWDDSDDELEITDCTACGRTYDDADADFLICHHCGYNAEEKTYGKASPEREDLF